VPRIRASVISLSLALASLVPLAGDSPFGDLSHWYTDHLHNSHAAWVFFHRPIAVYREPFGVARRGIAYRQAVALWDQMPMAYPPGMFVLFAPLATIGQVVPMSRRHFGVLGILYTLVLAHLAILAVWLALEAVEPDARIVVGLVSWLLLLRLGLQGFYDSAWIACAAMMVRALARGEPTTAMRWFAAAALLHFRAAAIAPLGLAAAIDAVRGKPPHAWPWTTLGCVGGAGILVIASFTLMYPATLSFRSQLHNLAEIGGGRLMVVVIVSAIAAVFAARWSDYAVAGMVVVCAILAVIDLEPWWWHGTPLLVPLVAVGAWRKASRPSAARGVLLAWLLVVQPLAFHGSPADVFVELADRFRP